VTCGSSPRYYTQVTLAHLVMSSGIHMSIKAISKIVTFTGDFLSDLKPADIYKLEQDRHPAAGWSTFMPYVKPLLAPPMKVDVKRCSVDQKLQRALYRDSLETMMFSLQVSGGLNSTFVLVQFHESCGRGI